jgi:hypothetical protein
MIVKMYPESLHEKAECAWSRGGRYADVRCPCVVALVAGANAIVIR